MSKFTGDFLLLCMKANLISMQRFNLWIHFQKDRKIKVENCPITNFEGNTEAKENNENL